MMSKHRLLFILILILPLVTGISPAFADIYRYVDAQGRVHFTDTPTHGHWNIYLKDNPATESRHRSYMKIIRQHARSYQLEEALVKAVSHEAAED